jgi:adhesin/invasin
MGLMMLSRVNVLCLALAAVITAACDTVPLTAPSGSALTVTAASTFVQPGGTTEITAYVVEQSGTAVQNGTTVHFSTNFGRVDPVDAQTTNGYARTTFIAGDMSGVADIVASSGGTGGTVTPPPSGDNGGGNNGGGGTSTPGTQNSSSVRITIGGAAADNVLLNASSTSVPLGGGTVTLTAAVLDANGNRLRNVPINFSTDAGTLSATVATTDASGEATVQLTTNRETTVTARSGAKSTTLRISVNAPSTISLTAVPPTLPSGGGSMTLTAVVLDVAGNRLPNVPVNFSTTAGTLSEAVATTDANGEAQTTLTTTAATTVTARAGSATQTLNVTLGSGVQIATTSPSSGTGAAGSTFVFTVTPGSGSVQNVTVDFDDGSSPMSLGAISGPTPVSHPFAAAGTYTVRATQTSAGGGTSTAFVVITVT